MAQEEATPFLGVFPIQMRGRGHLFGEDVEVGLSDDTSAGVDGRLHLGDLRVYVLHELNDEIHQLVLVHALGVEVGHQKGNVVALDGLSTEDHEWLRTLGQEAHKLLRQQLLQLVSLLHSNANAKRVDGSLDQNALLRSTSDDHGVQQELGRRPETGMGKNRGIRQPKNREIRSSKIEEKMSDATNGEFEEAKEHESVSNELVFFSMKRSHKHTRFACASQEHLKATVMDENDRREDVQGLNLGLVVTLDILRAKVLEAHGGSESRTNRVQVGSQSDRLQHKTAFHIIHNYDNTTSLLVQLQ